VLDFSLFKDKAMDVEGNPGIYKPPPPNSWGKTEFKTKKIYEIVVSRA
jgi:hypothetical protein